MTKDQAIAREKEVFFDKVEPNFLKLVRAFEKYKKALQEKWDSRTNCGNPHQREIDNLIDRTESFARICGIPLYEDIMAKSNHDKIVEEIEDKRLV